VKLTKTERPRTVDLSARLVTALRARQEELEKEALLAGEDLYVSYQLGHAKPTTTLLYYAHFMPRGDKKHLDRMMARRGSGFSPAFAPQREKGAASA